MQTDPKALNWAPYSVPLEVAQKRIANWIDNDQSEPVKPAQMRAFVVRREDFVELLAQHDTEFIRLYVGRKEEDDEPVGNQLRPCLLLVSAAYQRDIDPTAPNPDQIIDLVGKMPTGNEGQGAEETYDVFDFSRICPPICDEDSPLFVGKDTHPCG